MRNERCDWEGGMANFQIQCYFIRQIADLAVIRTNSKTDHFAGTNSQWRFMITHAWRHCHRWIRRQKGMKWNRCNNDWSICIAFLAEFRRPVNLQGLGFGKSAHNTKKLRYWQIRTESLCDSEIASASLSKSRGDFGSFGGHCADFSIWSRSWYMWSRIVSSLIARNKQSGSDVNGSSIPVGPSLPTFWTLSFWETHGRPPIDVGSRRTDGKQKQKQSVLRIGNTETGPRKLPTGSPPRHWSIRRSCHFAEWHAFTFSMKIRNQNVTPPSQCVIPSELWSNVRIELEFL